MFSHNRRKLLQTSGALLAAGAPLSATTASGKRIALTHDLTGNEIAIIKAGGLLNYVNDRQK